MRVLDIPTLISANNTNSEIGYFDTYPASNSANFNGAWSIYPYFESGNIIISDIERGLFVVRASDNPLSTKDFNLDSKFSLVPNPTKTNSKLTASKGQTITSVEVYNVIGKKLYSKNNINQDSIVLPTAHLSNGLYLVKINNTTTKKLVINK